jgi:hypothetical protein
MSPASARRLHPRPGGGSLLVVGFDLEVHAVEEPKTLPPSVRIGSTGPMPVRIIAALYSASSQPRPPT